MEAFMNPELAVAAEALELTVQLALDFIDDLVSETLQACIRLRGCFHPHNFQTGRGRR